MTELFLAYKGQRLQISESDHNQFMNAYPDVLLWQEYRIADSWLHDHPKRRGTKRFMQNWLKEEQRKASSRHVEARVGTGPSDMGYEIKVKRKYVENRQ